MADAAAPRRRSAHVWQGDVTNLLSTVYPDRARTRAVASIAALAAMVSVSTSCKASMEATSDAEPPLGSAATRRARSPDRPWLGDERLMACRSSSCSSVHAARWHEREALPRRMRHSTIRCRHGDVRSRVISDAPATSRCRTRRCVLVPLGAGAAVLMAWFRQRHDSCTSRRQAVGDDRVRQVVEISAARGIRRVDADRPIVRVTRIWQSSAGRLCRDSA